MNIRSLKTRILIGAIHWTAGLFAIAVVLMHFVFPPSSAHGVFRWLFRNGPAMALAGAVFMLFGLLQVRRGLQPINRLRTRLAAVHKGAAARVGGDHPVEVQPLVDDLNALLEERERRVARAVAKAGDLAHGLKTPLAVLAHEAQQAREAGHERLAAEIEQQIDRMRRQIDYHLAHARSAASAASSAARVSVAVSAEGLVRALKRLHAERDLNIEVDAPASHAFRGEREDLDEMLGNLLDNACKWAQSRVMLKVVIGELPVAAQRMLDIRVEDDGPGLTPEQRAQGIERGRRLDETKPGSGLGLSIVADLAQSYRGSFKLEQGSLGGLSARLELPAA